MDRCLPSRSDSIVLRQELGRLGAVGFDNRLEDRFLAAGHRVIAPGRIDGVGEVARRFGIKCTGGRPDVEPVDPAAVVAGLAEGVLGIGPPEGARAGGQGV